MSTTIPAGWSYYAGVGDHNFSCPYVVSGSVVTCFGGSLGKDDSANINVWLTAPSSSGGTFSVTATADPSNTITERSETNNTVLAVSGLGRVAHTLQRFLRATPKGAAPANRPNPICFR